MKFDGLISKRQIFALFINGKSETERIIVTFHNVLLGNFFMLSARILCARAIKIASRSSFIRQNILKNSTSPSTTSYVQ